MDKDAERDGGISVPPQNPAKQSTSIQNNYELSSRNLSKADMS